jgi:AhpD family alkylhydroperoxidase
MTIDASGVSIPFPDDSELSDANRELLASLPPANIFRMIANAPASLEPFALLARSILAEAELPARDREIAVLRVAAVTHANYEWVQHARIARMVGVTDDEIDAIAAGGDRLPESDRLLCRAADEISREVRLGDATLQQLLERYGVRQTTELILCVSYFNMVSRFLESARVALEDFDPVERWAEANR